MKISKKELKQIIKEEMSAVLNEGLHYEGLMEIMMDALNGELGSWQPEAKAEVYDELASKGLDLTQAALNILDDDAGRHPGGSIGEEVTHSSLGAARDPKEVFTSAHESLMQAHKDLQMLQLHMKNGGFDAQPTEELIKAIEQNLISLDGLPKEDVEKLSSLKGPLERGTRDI